MSEGKSNDECLGLDLAFHFIIERSVLDIGCSSFDPFLHFIIGRSVLVIHPFSDGYWIFILSS